MNRKIRVGVSSCLIGEKVRYDGGHKLDRFLTETLGRLFDLVPVCPEVECGLPVPREPMRLEGTRGSPRLVTIETRRDLTEEMKRWARRRVLELESDRLSGFVFKTRSPSCGMREVPICKPDGAPHARGIGFFARELMASFPLMPVEDEERLHDSAVRQDFIDRVIAYSGSDLAS